MTIRKASYGDIPAMSNLLSELFMIEDDFTVDIEKQARGLKILLDTPSAIVLVAQSDEVVIAMATLQTLVSTAAGDYVGLIEDVIVTKAYRSLGVGSKLLQAIIDEADDRGWGRLALGVDRRNEKAVSFYQKYKFSLSHMGIMYRL